MIIETSSQRYHVNCTGSSTLPGILMLHGFLGSGKDWSHHAERLQSRYACFMPDLPGHGTTTAADTATCSFEKTCESLAELAGKIHPEPLHLVGYSMGGRLALYLALHYPDLFRSSVIISSSPGLKTPEERSSRQRSDDLLAESITADFESFLDGWYDLQLFASLKTHSLFSEIFARRSENNPESLAAALRQLSTGRQPSLWEKLAENRLPTGFFVGEKDTKYVEIGRQMVNLCPDSALSIFPGCGHTLHIENRHLFLERLQLFLQKQENRREP